MAAMAQEITPGVPGKTALRAAVNFSALAAQESMAPAERREPEVIHPPMPIPSGLPLPTGVASPGAQAATAPLDPEPLPVPAESPAPASSFAALGDNNASIPPDTHGAVGPNHLMTTLNTQVRIQNRTGGVISTVTLNTFWSSVAGGSGVFDPKVLYDPFAGRWMFTACDDSRSATSGMLIGVSQTNDPTGTWNLYRIDADAADLVWADYPSMGFNKDWIAVQLNMFNVSDNAFNRSHIYVFDKANLYAGGASATHTLISNAGIGGTQVPALTYDNSLATLYLLQNWNGNSGGSGFLRLYTITGAIGSEVLTPVTFPSTANPWDFQAPGGLDFAPQLDSVQKIQNNDARLQNVVYRNGRLWTTHTVFLPAGGAPTRTAIQWWQLTTAGAIVQRARVDDSVGGNFYAFPSIAVNVNDDVLIGYSRYSATQYASANYAFRRSSDAANTLQSETVLKAGEAPYYKIFSGTRNRWGDYSSTVVDPVDDTTMWTIQEYAATASGGSDRWGTWWGQIVPNFVPTITGAVAGQAVTDKTTVSPFTAVTIGDADSPAQTLAIAVTLDVAAKGSFTTLNGFTNAGGGNYTFSGTAAAATTAIRGLVFTPAANRVAPGSTETTTLTISANDGIAAVVTNNTTTVVSTSVNDAPVATNLSAAENYTEDTTLNLINIVVTDPDVAGVTATLTLSNPAAGSLTTGTSGAVTSTYVAGTGVWTASGAVANVNVLLAGVSFVPAANFNANFTIATSVSDGVAAAVTGSKSMTGVAVNDAPTATNLSAAESYTEDTTLNLTDIVATDIDSASVTATLTLSNPAAGSLTTATSGAVTSTYVAGTGVWTASGAIANVNTLLAGVSFVPTANFNANFTIATSVSDGVAAAVTGSKSMSGTAVNDAPTATNLSAAESYTEDTTLNLIDIVASDIDSAAVTATLTLSNPAAGSLTTATSGAVTSTYVAGTGVWTASGAVANVNVLLAGVSFIPTANFNANFTIATSVSDGVAAAVTGSKSMTGVAVNDAPTATNLSAAESYTEDTTLNLIDIVASDIDSASVTATLTLSNPAAGSLTTATSGAVTSTYVAGTGVWTAAGAIANVNTLLAGVSFVPAANFNASFTIATSVSDGVAAAVTGSKAMSGIAVNDAPGFTKGGDGTVLEDAGAQSVSGWATAISAGPANENGQALDFIVTNDNNPLFAVQPTVAANGTLAYTPAPDANGSATVSVQIHDDGGTTGGGSDTSAVQTFTITITAVNDPPSYTRGGDKTLLEDAGAQTFAGWATAISAGPADESAQMVSFTVTNDNNALFSAQPAVAADGTLTFTPAANVSGSATVSVTASDSGDTANGGENTGATQTFTVNVIPVNDAPTLTAIGDPAAILEDAATQTINLSGIGAGGGESQALTVTATSDNPALIPNPTVTYTSANATGSLDYKPVADASGSATISVTVHDDGGTADGGINTVVQTFTVNVTAVNDAPTLASIADPAAILEDAAVQTINLSGITAGGGETQMLTVSATSDNPALIPNPTVSYTSTNATGSLSYTPVADASGSAIITVTVQDDGDTANGGVKVFTQTFTVNVLDVNDAPTLATIPDPAAILEDAEEQTIGLSGITAGGGETQTLTVTATSDNPALIPNPIVTYTSANATGSLNYTPVANVSGSATITVTVQDDGGTSSSGVDTITRTFTVNVTAVNDPPSFTKGTDVTVLEDAGAQSIAGWATAISAGPVDENTQALDFIVSADQPALFVVQPAVAANGTLTFTWAANGSGTATITVRLHDDGGGADTSAAQTFTISTTAVNDPPSFVAGANIDTAQDAGPQSFAGWATSISRGPADEGGQALDFIVTVDKPELFAIAPAIAPNGTLTYTPAPAGSGVAQMTVRLHDDGGIADGGVDTSDPQIVEIAVTSPLEELGSYIGLVQPAVGGARENARTGTVQVKVTKGAKFSGKLVLAGKRVAMKGIIGNDGAARFGKTLTPTLPVLRKGLPTLDLAVKIEVARGTNTFAGTLKQGAAGFAEIAGDRALYTSKRTLVAPMENVPPALLGAYTVLFPALTPAEQGVVASTFPQGDGFGKLTVTTKGIAKLAGTLADGSKISGSAPLAKSGRWPLYRAFGKTGSVSGFAFFRDVPAVSDVDAMDLLWFKSANDRAKQYADGWPGGILIDLAGSKYTAPTRRAPGPVLPGLGTADADGNVELSFTGGGLAGLAFALSIDVNNRLAIITQPSPSAKLAPKTGLLMGRFEHPGNGRKTPFGGAVLQKQKLGSGFFLGPTESGVVTLVPDEHPTQP